MLPAVFYAAILVLFFHWVAAALFVLWSSSRDILISDQLLKLLDLGQGNEQGLFSLHLADVTHQANFRNAGITKLHCLT